MPYKPAIFMEWISLIFFIYFFKYFLIRNYLNRKIFILESII
jgi:hypothetical protein